MSIKHLLAAVSVFAVVSAYADMTVELKVVAPSPRTGQPGESTVVQRIKGKKMRMDADKMTTSLVDLDAGKMYILEHSAKKVMAMPLDAMAKQADKMMAMFAAGDKTPPVSITATGNKKTIAGFNCTEYKVASSGPMQITATYWMAEDAKLNELEPFKQFTRDMSPTLGKDVFEKLKGLPVRTESNLQIAGSSIVSTTEITSVSHDSLQDDLFVIPAGYTVENLKLDE